MMDGVNVRFRLILLGFACFLGGSVDVCFIYFEEKTSGTANAGLMWGVKCHCRQKKKSVIKIKVYTKKKKKRVRGSSRLFLGGSFDELFVVA